MRHIYIYICTYVCTYVRMHVCGQPAGPPLARVPGHTLSDRPGPSQSDPPPQQALSGGPREGSSDRPGAAPVRAAGVDPVFKKLPKPCPVRRGSARRPGMALAIFLSTVIHQPPHTPRGRRPPHPHNPPRSTLRTPRIRAKISIFRPPGLLVPRSSCPYVRGDPEGVAATYTYAVYT